MSTTIVNKLDEVLKSNFDDILAEFNNAKNDIDFLPYKDGRQEGEWKVFGLKSIWGHWSKTSKIKFPTIRNIFENYMPEAVNLSISCLGPHSTTGWHTGIPTKSGMYKLANKGIWDWSLDCDPDYLHIPLTRGKHYAYKMHLGLQIPSDEFGLGLETESHIYRWKEKETFVFKDWELHRAWNRTDEERYVLFWDIPKEFFETALSSAGLEQQPSKLWVVGSSPTGQANSSPVSSTG